MLRSLPSPIIIIILSHKCTVSKMGGIKEVRKNWKKVENLFYLILNIRSDLKISFFASACVMLDIANLAEISQNHARHVSEASHLKANIADHQASVPGGSIMQMQKPNEAIWWDMFQTFKFISHTAYGKWPRLQYSLMTQHVLISVFLYASLSNQDRMFTLMPIDVLFPPHPPADLGVRQPCCLAGRRKLQIQSHDWSVGKPKQLKDRQSELWHRHLDETRNTTDSILPQCFVLVFVFHDSCYTFQSIYFQTKDTCETFLKGRPDSLQLIQLVSVISSLISGGWIMKYKWKWERTLTIALYIFIWTHQKTWGFLSGAGY